MIGLPWQLGALAAVAVASGAAAWWLTREHYIEERIAYITSQRAAEVELIRRHAEEVLALQARNHDAAARLDAQHAKHQSELDKALADNRDLARKLGGLRDPGRRPTSSCPVPAATNAASQPAADPAAGRLSDEASEFLLAFSRAADEAAAYARTCHAWVKTLDDRSQKE